MTCRLTRDGNGRTLTYDFETKRRALQWVGQSLYDNGYPSKADAQIIAATITLDVPRCCGPYTFTLIKLPTTSTQDMPTEPGSPS